MQPSPMNNHNSLFIPDDWPTFSLSFQRPSFESPLSSPSPRFSPEIPDISCPTNELETYGPLRYGLFVVLTVLRQTF